MVNYSDWARKAVDIENSYMWEQIRKNPIFENGGIRGDGDCDHCWCRSQCTDQCLPQRRWVEDNAPYVCTKCGAQHFGNTYRKDKKHLDLCGICEDEKEWDDEAEQRRKENDE